jgi:hypothetical protein
VKFNRNLTTIGGVLVLDGGSRVAAQIFIVSAQGCSVLGSSVSLQSP